MIYGIMNRKDFQTLAATRRREAKLLLDANCFDGAYYLSGYAVELALKACIAKTFIRHTWPNKEFVNAIHTHDVSNLVKKAGLETALDQKIATNPAFGSNWSTVKDWDEHSRYECWSKLDAKNLYRAVASRKNGILPWVRQHW